MSLRLKSFVEYFGDGAFHALGDVFNEVCQAVLVDGPGYILEDGVLNGIPYVNDC